MKTTTNCPAAEKFASMFAKLGINATEITVLGSWVHIDTFPVYEQKVYAAMSKAGATCKTMTTGKDGCHLDGSKAFRVVAKF